MADFSFAVDYWHITVNPAGTVWDAVGPDVAKNAAVRAAARIRETSWDVELAIPIKDLGLGEPGGRAWKANVCRQDKVRGELSSWNAVSSGFCEPRYFGTWQFAE